MKPGMLLKVGIVVSSIGIAVYSTSVAYSAYKMYQDSKQSSSSTDYQDYERKYIDSFIRRLSRISK